jgi:hypothetical protein
MKIDTELVTLELLNGIIVGRYKEILVDLSAAKELLNSRTQFTANKSYPMAIDCTLLKGVDKEARDFFALPSGSEGLTATALIVRSRFSSFFVNFLINVNLYKSNLPIRMFNEMDEALKWLEKYK